jgi:hypothetical protein
MKLLGIVLGIIAILIAIDNFDIYNFNRMIVSILLFMSGILTLSRNEKLKERIRITAVALVIFVIMKLLITG